MIRKSIIKIASILIIAGLNWAGLSAVWETVAYFNDTENSLANSMQAAILDFSLTNGHIEDFIGMEALSEIEFASVVTKTTGSLNIQYEVNAEKISGDDDFCDALKMEVEHNGVEKHDGSLLSFSASPTTQLGTWEFEIDLPASATNVPHGAECNVDLVFKGWRSDVVNFEESGFTDEERIELRLTSRMIVLNEFLPNPDPSAHGLDFGNDADTMPKGEWVELYNNSDFAFDLSGYYLTDADGNRIDVEGCRTNTSGTIVASNGFLVVYRKGGESCTSHNFSLNNDGDTVKLFNQDDELVDSYTYTGSDHCEMEPTPGDENTEDVGGSCGGVPPNKSYARIPDGIGYWVDPIPTPGGPNKLEEVVSEEQIFEEEPITEEMPIVEEPIEEELAEEIPVIEGESIEEEVITEENQEQGGITEEINEIIDEIIDEIVDEIMPDEETGDEVVSEPEVPVIDEAQVIEEAPADETPAVEEQPATEEQPAGVPDNDSSQNGANNNSDNNSSDGGSSGDSTNSSNEMANGN